MNHKELDSNINFKYYDDKINAVKALGYSYISEAMIDLYANKKTSMPKIARMMNNEITKEAIGRWLKVWGIKARPKGGDTSVWPWPDNCMICNKPTKKLRRSYGMHDGCWYKFKRGTKNWIIKYTKSAEGLTRLKKDLGIVHPVDNQLLISALNKL